MRHIAVALAILGCAAARPCLPITSDGLPVHVSNEKVLLIWDRDTKTEHFVRTAQFASSAEDLGFLVPLPSTPEIVEVDPAAFDTAHQALLRSAGGGFGGAPGGVDVIKEQTVGGYKVAVLKAESDKELLAWLQQNGYPASPAIKDWLNVYVKKGYVITAFKYAGQNNGQFETKPIRLTFKTEQLFYPYRERADSPATPGRWWTAYVISDSYLSASLADGGKFRGRRSDDTQISAADLNTLAAQLKLKKEDLAGNNRISLFSDMSGDPRPQSDLVFTSHSRSRG